MSNHNQINAILGQPSEPPPPYQAAPAAKPSSTTNDNASNHLQVPTPKSRNGIPPSSRRSMEDEARSLPPGWVRQYDAQEHHQFFVDTSSSPPRSIWHHPYDDEKYLSTLPPAERNKIEGLQNENHRRMSQADMEAESSEDDSHWEGQATGGGYGIPGEGQRTQGGIGQAQGGSGNEEPPKGVHKLGRRMKDKLTSSTHQEREQSRQQREEAERAAYAQHQRFRAAMSKAYETGEPQLLGRDKDGKDVYIEPPQGMGRQGGYQNGGYGFNPYTQGPYSSPNARFVRPQQSYNRPPGYGYGGGFGYGGRGGYGGMGMGGMAMPLMGGMMMGGLLF